MDVQTASQQLSARQKAAIIVGVVLGEGEDIDLARLPVAVQTGLAQEMSLMGLVDRETRNSVITEFCDRLEAVGLSFPGDIDGTLDLLESHLDALAQMRLWLAGQSGAPIAATEEVGLEDFSGGTEAEAFAGSGVQPGTEFPEILLGQAVRIGIAAEPTPQPFIGIFHRALLPGRLGLAEPCLGTDLGLQMRPVDELGAAIEGY